MLIYFPYLEHENVKIYITSFTGEERNTRNVFDRS